MKKILLSILVLFCLSGCAKNNSTNANNQKYLDYCELLSEQDTFLNKSEFFDISTDITACEEGYRYYIVIDNPKIAMYDIEAIAIEKDVDYTKNMAANIGIFEDNKYSFIPNQYNASEGFVKGFSISGLSTNPNPTLYMLIEWYNSSLDITKREFIKVDINNGVVNG